MAETASEPTNGNRRQFNKGKGIFAQNVTNDEKFGKKKNNKVAGSKIALPVVKHQEGVKWHEYQINERSDSTTGLSPEKVAEVRDEADLLLRTDADLYSRLLRTQGGSEAAWLQTVVSKGTASDRMTAMQLHIRKSPVHAISMLRQMVQQVEKKHAREAMDTIPVLEQLFIEELLPQNRKLIPIEKRPLDRINEIASGSEQGRQRTLVLWMFEHELKIIYATFVQSLEVLTSGAVESVILRSVKAISHLLAERPEAEQQLLTTMVNKLGHPNYKVGARVAQLLEVLSCRQPNMRPIIVNEVERVVYRKNVNERAHLYASVFLSSVTLRTGDADLAVQMLSIYFGLFKTLISRKKSDNKLLRILLFGANRAFPYAKEKAESLVGDIDTLYKMVHTSTFAVSLQTLKLLFQVLNLSDSLSDRYYTALYRKLFDRIPQNMYNQLLMLLFRTLKADTVDNRVRAIVKRILQLAVSEPPPFAAGLLILVSKLAEARPGLIVTKKNADMVAARSAAHGFTGDDDDEEVYVDLDDDGKPIRRVKVESGVCVDDDVKQEVVENCERSEKKQLKGRVHPAKTQGWVHKKNQAHHGGVSLYDPSARNPLFVSTADTIDAELHLLAKHYHPSIAVFASSLLRGDPIRYSGDPLEDFTTIRFLDRFVYKNPKERKPQSSDAVPRRKKSYDPWGVKKLQVTSKEYLMKRTEEIPADERFLHRFATLKFQPKPEQADAAEDWGEVESVNSDEFEMLLERFEPGEKNDEFDIDFGKEFSVEKKKKDRGEKRKAKEEDGEDDEMLGDDDWEDDEDGEKDDGDEDDEDVEEGGDDDDEDEDDWDDDDVVMEDDEDEDEEGGGFFGGGKGGKKGKADFGEDSDDEDYGEADAFMSADKFAEMLEEGGEEEIKEKLRKKIRKPKGFKKRGKR